MRRAEVGAASPLDYSKLCENMQSTGPGLQLLIYYGAATASRQKWEQQQPGGVLQGPAPEANTVSV